MSLKPIVLETEIHGDYEGTLRGFFCALAMEVWRQGEGFSGKRPFGNSGWQYDVYAALIKAGHIKGTLDEEGYVDEVNEQEVDKLILELVDNYL